MIEVVARLALFTLLPVLLGAALIIFDRSATGPVRRAEAFLVPLLIVGVGGGGLSAFIEHVFISDALTRTAGGEPGSAFQLQVGFAYLAIGLLGAVAAEWRDGFREATVAAAAVFGVGATVAHFLVVVATDTLLAGGALQIVSDFATPALLIWFLLALRRAERTEPTTIVLRSWMIPVRRGSVATVAIATAAIPVGHATGQLLACALAAIVVAAGVFWWMVSRAPSHRAV